jgi:capsular exopolysaccharide synthesis family protein
MSRVNRRNVPSKLLVGLSPHGSAAEAYRLLRANLRFASVDKPLRSLAVTSALENEGKTLTAANLAICSAQAGVRTLLVDADLRKPAVHKIFVTQNRTGMTSVLVGMQKMADVVQSTQVDNLWLLTAGDKPPNPAELLQSESMQHLHHRLTADFEFVIYDCPPVLPAVEAVDLGALADGTLVVVRAEVGPKDAVRQALEQLRHGHAQVLGTVLNGVRPNSYGYNYYSYSYTYGA